MHLAIGIERCDSAGTLTQTFASSAFFGWKILGIFVTEQDVWIGD